MYTFTNPPNPRTIFGNKSRPNNLEFEIKSSKVPKDPFKPETRYTVRSQYSKNSGFTGAISERVY